MLTRICATSLESVLSPGAIKRWNLTLLSLSLSLTSYTVSLVVFATVFCGKEVSLNAFIFSGHKASAVFMIHSIMNSPSRDDCECRAINPDTVKLISTTPHFLYEHELHAVALL